MFSIKTKGFTLIEVLIAMIVLAFGLLGLAGLQASGLKQNQDAHLRSQATTLAYDFADRMRANSSQCAVYIANAAGNGTQTASCLTTAGCTPTQMANHDIFAWKNQITSTLPSGTGVMTQIAGAGTACPILPSGLGNCDDDVYTVTLSWDDDRDPASAAISFNMSFKI